MVRYVKCPRCELNYIDADKQEYCDVCIAELKGSKLQFADLDADDYDEIDAELEQEELCPVCGVNHIRAGEKMCETCKQQQEYNDEQEVDLDKDEEWKNYLEEDDDGDLTVDEDLQEEIEEEFAEEEDEDEYYDGNDDEEDFDDIDGDLDDLGDEDDEDEEDDDEDEEDEEDDDF